MAETLLQALLNIQAKAPRVQKDGINPFTESRYMQLDSVVEVVTPMLTEEGLLWQARPSIDDDGRDILRYSLTHVATKEAVEDRMRLMLKQASPQDQGSAITYARRYALVCALNLVTDRDDDGHAATQAAVRVPEAPQPPQAQAQATLSTDEQKNIRQIVTDLAAELEKDFPEAWATTVEWAKQREIDLTSPPADKLRAVERALRRKRDAEKAKADKAAAAEAKKAAATAAKAEVKK